jgi:hypothetical protein
MMNDVSKASQPTGKDQDFGKGAVEQDSPTEPTNTSLQGQLGHRDQDPRLKGADTDFPEPGENPEHTGEPEEKTGSRKT